MSALGEQLQVDPAAPPPQLDFLAFGPGRCLERKLVDLDSLPRDLPVIWLNVDGLGDVAILEKVGHLFGLHLLSLEDVVNVHQRAKVDYYDEFLVVVMRMLHDPPGQVLTSERLVLFLGKDFVLTFQEGVPGDCLEHVREKLRKNHAKLRQEAADFLAYQIIDGVIDSYFPVLETLGEKLEQLETEVFARPSRQLVNEVHNIKRELLAVRRAVWPLREALSTLCREDTPLISAATRPFLRDCYDHCVQVIDLVESYRELGSSLMDIYLGSVSNRMNEVMQVLTMITTIFVPLTFVAGVYGMNFNPEKSPWNMPELNAYYGYPVAILVMGFLAVLELAYFWRKGWLFRSR
jgi:magnesium transporter